MTTNDTTLLDTLDLLKDAIDQADWSQAGRLDREIKAKLEKAIQKADTDQDKKLLVDLLGQIQVVYSLLLENSEQAKKQISLELKKITQDKKASDLYLRAAKFK